MKKFFLFAGATFFVLTTILSGCKKEQVLPTAENELPATSSAKVNPESANTTPTETQAPRHTVIEFPGDFTTHLDCLGEDVAVTGTVRLTIITVVNDNHYTMKIIARGFDSKAVGLSSGNEFFVRGENSTTKEGSYQNGQARTSYVNSFSYIGKGQLPNIYFHQVTNLVINADGTVTASVDKPTITCVQ